MERIHSALNKFYIGAFEEDPVAFVTYHEEGETHVVIEHVYVSRELREQGIGKLLVQKMVEHAREKGKKLKSTCSYADTMLLRELAYRDVYSE
ncbi:GNAT family N-acetyltransferase [Eubacteriaceae bacterium ES2]|nr:GNAT family N-acetyltransferase [Eubacteriaceae bacterium ES2]